MGGNELADDLRRAFQWREGIYAEMSRWWRGPNLLARLGPAVAELHAPERPSVVAAVASRGFLLGPLVATHLQVGFVEIKKDRKHVGSHGRGSLRRDTPPDYAQRDLTLSIRDDVLTPRDRVLLVDDWLVTGAQAQTSRTLIEDTGASWLGAAVLVDDCTAGIRRQLNARSLLVAAQL